MMYCNKNTLQGRTFKVPGLNIFENCPNSPELVTLAPTLAPWLHIRLQFENITHGQSSYMEIG
jgi:hypothetical protein